MDALINTRINIMVTDMDRSVSFYTSVLGMELLNRYGDYYAEIQAPNIILGLHPKPESNTVGNALSIGFASRDLENDIAKLKEAGIDCHITQDGPIRIAHFADPDQHPLYLTDVSK